MVLGASGAKWARQLEVAFAALVLLSVCLGIHWMCAGGAGGWIPATVQVEQRQPHDRASDHGGTVAAVCFRSQCAQQYIAM